MTVGALLPSCLLSGKQNQTKTDISKPKEAFIALFFDCPKSEVSHSDLTVFDAFSLSPKLFLALWSIKHDLDMNPKLSLLAASTAQVDEIMTQLSAWLLGSCCRGNPGKKYFQCLPSAGLESQVAAEQSMILNDY